MKKPRVDSGYERHECSSGFFQTVENVVSLDISVDHRLHKCCGVMAGVLVCSLLDHVPSGVR
jgi:hypothetical protein